MNGEVLVSMTTDNPIWNKQPGETKQSYRAFSIYRDMGVGRSLDKAYVLFLSEQRHDSTKTAPKKAATEAPRHWSDWSSKFGWVERASAFDAHMDAELQAQFESELLVKRQQVIRQELADSELQMSKWHEMVNATPLHMQKRSARKKKADAGEVDIVFAHLTIDDWYKLSRWRGEIGDQLRRALGMPITRTDVTTGGEKLPGNVVLNIDDMADVFKQIQRHKDEKNAGS